MADLKNISQNEQDLLLSELLSELNAPINDDNPECAELIHTTGNRRPVFIEDNDPLEIPIWVSR